MPRLTLFGYPQDTELVVNVVVYHQGVTDYNTIYTVYAQADGTVSFEEDNAIINDGTWSLNASFRGQSTGMVQVAC